jgi:hypothetical protein
MDLERELDRFLRQQIFAEREDGAAPYRLVLRHAAAGTKGNDVESFAIKEGFSTDDLREFRNTIIERAQSDADGMGGVQRYVLHAYLKGEPRSVGRFSFRVRGGDEEYDESGGEEPATQKGLLTQLMRHNEQNNKNLTASIGAMVGSVTRRLEAQDALIEKLIRQRMEYIELVEEMKSKQHDRDMALLQLESSEKRKDAIFEKVQVLVPVLLNKLIGKNIVPSDDPLVLQFKELISTLDKGQFERILQSLNSPQQISLITLLQSMQAAEEKKNEQKKLKGEGEAS